MKRSRYWLKEHEGEHICWSWWKIKIPVRFVYRDFMCDWYVYHPVPINVIARLWRDFVFNFVMIHHERKWHDESYQAGYHKGISIGRTSEMWGRRKK